LRKAKEVAAKPSPAGRVVQDDEGAPLEGLESGDDHPDDLGLHL
jgi:hypothetical protein